MKILNPVLSSILVLSFSLKALGGEDDITLHLECLEVSSECIEMEHFDPSEGKKLFKKSAEMKITANEVLAAGEVEGEFPGRNQINIRLTEAAGEELRQVTERAINSPLAIVTKGKIVTAPIVFQAISGGSFVISFGYGEANDQLSKIPWLQKIVEDQKDSQKKFDINSILIYSLLAIGLIGGALYVAFFRKV